MTTTSNFKGTWYGTPTSTFDFGDGRGRIPAHRHQNTDGSEGGWVANTAHVDLTAYVGPEARVLIRDATITCRVSSDCTKTPLVVTGLGPRVVICKSPRVHPESRAFAFCIQTSTRISTTTSIQ